MTLLTRSIKTSNNGLSYLDKAIQKFEADKMEIDTNLDEYGDLLSGMKASGTYLGNKSKTILNEYSRAFEQAIDAYASDPSRENQDRIDRIKLETTDFLNRATATRKNSLTQFYNLMQSPGEYVSSVEEARAMLNQNEEADISASYDPTTGQMRISDQQGSYLLGQDGYYNGESPLFYEKRSKLSQIKAEGEWAFTNKDRYLGMMGLPGSKEKVIEAFVETGLVEGSPYQETAIYNYLQDVKGLNIRELDARQLEQQINKIKGDQGELYAALSYMGEKEYGWLSGAKDAENAVASSKAWDNFFTGAVQYREDRKEDESVTGMLTGTEGVDESKAYIDPYAGADAAYMLKQPLKHSDLPTLGQNDILRGLTVDANGNIIPYIDVVTMKENEDGEMIEQIEKSTPVLSEGQLYDNLYTLLTKNGLYTPLQERALQNKAAYEDRENSIRIARAYANSPDVETPEEFRVFEEEAKKRYEKPLMSEEAATKEATAEEVEDIKEDISMFDPGFNVIVSPTTGERGVFVAGLNKKFIDRLVEEGDYSAQEIRDGLQYMRDNDMTVEVSPLRSFFQRTLGRGDDLQRAVDTFDVALRRMKQEKQDAELAESRKRSDELFGRDYRPQQEGQLQAKDIAVANRRDQGEKEQFYTTLRDLGEKYDVIFPEVMAIQGIKESGWGNSESAPNNIFGIKYSPTLLEDMKEQGIDAFMGSEVTTKEEVDGELRDQQAKFMGFGSIEDAVRGYKYLIDSRSAYKDARTAETAEEYTLGLKGYATDSSYLESIKEIATDSLGIDLSQITRRIK